MKRAWALGTTAIPQGVDGKYCVCAIQENGEIEYGAMLVPQNAIVPVGQLLEAAPGTTWAATTKNDLQGLLRVAATRAREWNLVKLRDAQHHATGWHSPDIYFDASVSWYVSTTPKSPACTMSEYSQMKCWTSIVLLRFGLRRLDKFTNGEAEIYYRPIDRDDGDWTVKYDGSDDAPSVIYEGAMLGVFVSPHRRSEYSYLKIGSVLQAR
ncbi:hypothetical protein WMF26_39065 [Sorangium sp. So ce185]|uniref:hypothetical protein n=1 Tax=Sorangium sp. So ce185 TaxID=3133287 RepID=UPI003F60BD30